MVDVGSADFEFGSVADAVVGDTSLPYWLGEERRWEKPPLISPTARSRVMACGVRRR